MPTLEELRAVGMALQLPHALRRRGCGGIQYAAAAVGAGRELMAA